MTDTVSAMTEDSSGAKRYEPPEITRRETVQTLGASGIGGAMLQGSMGRGAENGEGRGVDGPPGQGGGSGSGDVPPGRGGDNPGRGGDGGQGRGNS